MIYAVVGTKSESSKLMKKVKANTKDTGSGQVNMKLRLKKSITYISTSVQLMDLIQSNSIQPGIDIIASYIIAITW